MMSAIFLFLGVARWEDVSGAWATSEQIRAISAPRTAIVYIPWQRVAFRPPVTRRAGVVATDILLQSFLQGSEFNVRTNALLKATSVNRAFIVMIRIF